MFSHFIQNLLNNGINLEISHQNKRQELKRFHYLFLIYYFTDTKCMMLLNVGYSFKLQLIQIFKINLWQWRKQKLVFCQVYFLPMQAGLRYARHLFKGADLANAGEQLRHITLLPSDAASFSLLDFGRLSLWMICVLSGKVRIIKWSEYVWEVSYTHCLSWTEYCVLFIPYVVCCSR